MSRSCVRLASRYARTCSACSRTCRLWWLPSPNIRNRLDPPSLLEVYAGECSRGLADSCLSLAYSAADPLADRGRVPGCRALRWVEWEAPTMAVMPGGPDTEESDAGHGQGAPGHRSRCRQHAARALRIHSRDRGGK